MSERGVYRPIDTDRNPVIAWGARAAASEGMSRAIGWAVSPAIPVMTAVDRGVRIRDGARGVYRGATVLGGRGAPPLEVVGQEWWHGVEDRSRAIEQITTDFGHVATDLMSAFQGRRDAAAAHPSDAATAQITADVHWLATDIQPTLEEWKAFVARERDSTWNMLATSWETFEAWQERVKRLRELARARGFTLTSPEPVPLPKTVWERGAEGAGGPAAWLGVLKVTIGAAVAIAGFVSLYAALKSR